MGSMEPSRVQGLLRRGYRQFFHAAYHLVRFRNQAGALDWLATVASVLAYASDDRACDVRKPRGEGDESWRAMVAFTPSGLRGLGLDEEAMQTFPRAFLEGMTTPARAAILGDIGPNAPEHWSWGGEVERDRIDAVLMIYARSSAALESAASELVSGHAGGVEAVKPSPLIASQFHGGPEHFGFADGISNPGIVGLNYSARHPGTFEQGRWSNGVPAGEFILGFRNLQGDFPPSPSVREDTRAREFLSGRSPWHADRRDLGRHGSFLVLRQLAQDVAGFWNYIHQASSPGTPREVSACEPIAAKMIGRWRNGAPLVTHPDGPPPAYATRNEAAFGYRGVDGDGLRCPVGAHIRRTAPRDSLGSSAEIGVFTGRLHRILRRARSYGPEVPETARFVDDGEPRGLFFICLNASIERQFEFVQQSWACSGAFGGLEDERDPLIGNPLGDGRFSIPRRPVREVLERVPRFVTTKGGAYFFLPGRDAIEYLLQRRVASQKRP